MRKFFALMAALAVTLAISVQAQAVTQLGLLLDSSGSINVANFNLMKTGFANAILNLVPVDSSVEITAVQFSTGAFTIVTPTLIDSVATRTAVANLIANAVKISGGTDLAAGLDTLTNLVVNSPVFQLQNTVSIYNITTDGVPNSESAAIASRNAALAAGIDAISAEAVAAPSSAVTFLLNSIVSPQAGVLVPANPFPNPSVNGFVVVVDTFDDFADAIAQKFQVVVPPQPPSNGAIPEPISAGLSLMALGALSLSLRRRRA